MSNTARIEQFKRDVKDLSELIEGKQAFMFNSFKIHQRMKSICEAYFGYVPSTIKPPWADETPEVKAKRIVDELWAELGDVIVDEEDNIEQGWKHFPAGTNKLEIWHWIEETYDVSIAEDLMNSITG